MIGRVTIERGPPKDETWAGYTQRFPHGVRIAQRIVFRLEPYLSKVEQTWELVKRPNWIAFQRPGRFDPVLVHISADPVEFVVKLRKCPKLLGHPNPYEDLREWWDEEYRQWQWAIEKLNEVPNDLTIAVDISRKYQPKTGEMEAPLTTAPCDQCTCERSRRA